MRNAIFLSYSRQTTQKEYKNRKGRCCKYSEQKLSNTPSLPSFSLSINSQTTISIPL